MNLHLGFIHQLVFRYLNSLTKPTHETDEVVSVAYIEAERLLREKYDPSKGRVTTFLRSYLIGRVEYQIHKDLGLRKRSDGWKNAKQLHRGGNPYNQEPPDRIQFEELLERIHPDFRHVARDLAEGRTLLEIVKAHGLDSFDFYDEHHEDLWVAAAQLRRMMQVDLRPHT